LKVILPFKYQTYDSAPILSGQKQQGIFFTQEEQLGVSETVKAVAELVEWLFQNNTFKQMLFDEISFRNYTKFLLQTKRN